MRASGGYYGRWDYTNQSHPNPGCFWSGANYRSFGLNVWSSDSDATTYGESGQVFWYLDSEL